MTTASSSSTAQDTPSFRSPPPTPVLSKDDGTDNPAAAGAHVRRVPRPGWLLVIVLTGQFMSLLDTFIVNVAAPELRADLHISGSGLQLVVAGYSIAYAVLLITGARLGGLLGHSRAFLCGLVVFTGASLACGLASSGGQLTAFRLVQGAGAAMMLPQVLSLIQRTFTGTSRSRALGAYAAVLGVGAAAGQILGGVLVDADLFGWGWRPVFLINVPVGVLLLAVGPWLMAARYDGPDEGARRSLDLSGLVLLAAAVLLFTVPVVLGREQGWPVWGWVSLGLCAALFALFAWYETRLARRGGSPLISPRVLRAPGVPVAVFRICCMMAVNSGFFFVLMLHFQEGLGQSALRAGLTLIPTAVAFAVTGTTWRMLPATWHPALSATGFLVATGAFLWLGELLSGQGEGGPWLYVCLAFLGMGLSLAFNPVLTRTLGGIRQSEAADASGLLVTTAQLGLLLGVAVFGALFLQRVDGAAPAPAASAGAATATCAVLAAAALAGGLVGPLSRVVRRVRREDR
ncbi:MFS transporter [Streptomyces iconiensis]|uniref:MFS transporter n=1 Tax=Streptomyces iconiensis TaxID=1384038 RepID=A0ABT6ZMW0_9ACTN|nr:MFS transporter [Streptomyces iconiensis]MDJ1130399.1 MFS transporter [Streptomyces iconiensis]